MILADLFGNYVKKNIIMFIVYFIIIFMTTPLETLTFSYFFGILFPLLQKPDKNKTEIIRICIFISVLYTVTRVATMLKDYLQIKYIPQFTRYVREFLFQHVTNSSKILFENPRAGEIISRINNLPWAIRSIMPVIFKSVIPPLMIVLVAFSIIFKINRKLGLFLILGFVATILNTWWRFDQCVDLYVKENTTYFNLVELVQDKLSNIMEIHTNANLDQEMQNNTDNEFEYEKSNYGARKCIYDMNVVTTLICIVTIIVFIKICYTDFFKKKMSAGEMISLFVALTYYIEAQRNFAKEFQGLARGYGNLKEAEMYVKDVIRVRDAGDFENSPAVDVFTEIKKSSSVFLPAKEAKPKPRIIGNLSANNLSFAYSSNQPIVDNLSFKTKPGTMTMLWGESGRGKSTLAKLLLGFFHPSGGTITIDGHNIKHIDLDHYRANIGYVNQTTTLFNDTILANLKYANSATDEEIKDFMDKYNIHYIFKNVRGGIHKNVGVNGGEMSGGQKQMILIMRAIFSGKKILIFDEPTSALDTKGKDILLAIVKDYQPSRNFIFISHDNRLDKSMFDQIVRL